MSENEALLYIDLDTGAAAVPLSVVAAAAAVVAVAVAAAAVAALSKATFPDPLLQKRSKHMMTNDPSIRRSRERKACIRYTWELVSG